MMRTRTWLAACCLAAGLAAGSPSALPAPYRLEARIEEPTNAPPRQARLKTTGYCKCGECCGWRRSWFGLGSPVIASGPLRGRPKEVGVTAAHTRARPGVIAADPDLFPFGTIFYVPGYGWGRVEDVGGAIKGYHLDLYFTSHAAAQRWGVKKQAVRFWRPPGAEPKGVRIIPGAPAEQRPAE